MKILETLQEKNTQHGKTKVKRFLFRSESKMIYIHRECSFDRIRHCVKCFNKFKPS